MTGSEEKIRDRRSNGRIQVDFPVELRDIDFAFRGSAVDLSPGGVKVRLAGAPPLVNTDLDIVLRPPGEPAIPVKGRVMHGRQGLAGIAFAVGDPEIFEAALNLYESIVMRDPKLAIRLKLRPTTLTFAQRIWPLALSGATLTGPEHWVWGRLSGGTTIADLKQAIGAEWAHVAYVPFMLLERNLAALTEPAAAADDDPGNPIGGLLQRMNQETAPLPRQPTGSRPAAPLPRQPTGSRPAAPLPRQPTGPEVTMPGRKPSGSGWPRSS